NLYDRVWEIYDAAVHDAELMLGHDTIVQSMWTYLISASVDETADRLRDQAKEKGVQAHGEVNQTGRYANMALRGTPTDEGGGQPVILTRGLTSKQVNSLADEVEHRKFFRPRTLSYEERKNISHMIIYAMGDRSREHARVLREELRPGLLWY